MLSILRRSDINLFKFVSESGANDEAVSLSAGHCFQVNVVCSILVDRKRFLGMMAPYRLINNWYATDLPMILSLWVSCLEGSPESESLPPSQRQDTEAEEEESQSDEDDLFESLSYCDPAEAPLATEIRKFIFEHMGKADGKLELAKLVSKTMKQNGKMRRIYCYKINRSPMSYKLIYFKSLKRPRFKKLHEL